MNYIGQWSFDDRLVDLSKAIGHFSDLFDPDALGWNTWPNGITGQKALYGLPIGRTTTHLHIWKSILERAGFTLADIPKEWDAFWAFWCDEVQPAVRKALGRDDIWGIGLPMSTGVDTQNAFFPFLAAYQAHYVTRDGRLVIDDPEVRQRLVKAIDSYTAIYRKGCTPPGSVAWDNSENNKQFLAQAIVMTANGRSRSPTRSRASAPTTTTRIRPRSNGHLIRLASPFQFSAVASCPAWFSRAAPRRDRGRVRSLSRGRGLARPLPQLFRRAHAAGDAEAARCAVLARPERPASHGRGDAGQLASPELRLHRGSGRLAPRQVWREFPWGKAIHRSHRGHQPRAGGRRGHRADQADPERVADLPASITRLRFAGWAESAPRLRDAEPIVQAPDHVDRLRAAAPRLSTSATRVRVPISPSRSLRLRPCFAPMSKPDRVDRIGRIHRRSASLS